MNDKKDGAAEKRQPLALVVAVAQNGVIGKENGLPWHISSDLKRFRALTMGKPLLMGRKTFESIGRPLPGRETILISRDPTFVPPLGIYHASSIDAALALAAARAEAMKADEIIIAGGSEIFAALLDRTERMYVTFIDAAPKGDVFFPPVDWSDWQEIHREDHLPQKGDDAAFSFVDFVRRDSLHHTV
jgi:dihydrofolate reductase